MAGALIAGDAIDRSKMNLIQRVVGVLVQVKRGVVLGCWDALLSFLFREDLS